MDHIAHIRIECNKNNEVGVEEKVTEHSKKVAVLVDIYSSPFRMASALTFQHCCMTLES